MKPLSEAEKNVWSNPKPTETTIGNWGDEEMDEIGEPAAATSTKEVPSRKSPSGKKGIQQPPLKENEKGKDHSGICVRVMVVSKMNFF